MPSQEISFDADIKPLFREKDRDSMRNSFDLWSYADTKAHAAPIAERLNPPSASRCSNAGSRSGCPDRTDVIGTATSIPVVRVLVIRYSPLSE
jgi:hypothetical protein